MPLEAQTGSRPTALFTLNRFVTDRIVQKVHGGRQHGEVGSRRPSRLTKNSVKHSGKAYVPLREPHGRSATGI